VRDAVAPPRVCSYSSRENSVKRMPRSLRPLLMLLALAMVAAACAADDDADAPGDDDAAVTDDDAGDDDEAADTERRRFRMGGFAADVGLTDPQYANAGMDRQTLIPVFEGLVRYVPNDMLEGFEPAIATEVPEAPEPNDDGTQTWEFEIREGVMCHDGPDWDAYELTPEMVVESYEKTMDSDRAAFSGDYSVVDSVEVGDEGTVHFNLSTPRSEDLFLPLVADFAGGYVVCMDHLDGGYDATEDFSGHPVGTGPYKWVEYNPGDGVQMDAFDEYWRGEPGFAGIDMLFMADDSSRTLALQSGEIDFMYGVLERQWVDRIDGEDGLTALAMPVGGLHNLHINMEMEPFDQLEVRQAIAYAQNREAHIAVGGEGVKVPACALEPLPGAPGGLSCEEAAELGLDYSHDPDRARELLAEAGLEDGFSFEVTTSELEIYSDHYQVLQANLAEVGIDMAIDVVDHPTMHSVIREDANGVVQYLAPRPTMDQLLMQFAHSSAIVVEGSAPVTNFSHFSDGDALIEEAQVSIDADEQAELWREVNIMILEQAAIIGNTHDNDTFAWTDEFDPGTALNGSLESSFKITHDATFR
jgi:peptide/nickel transport system substrate-binding protein